MGVESFDVPPSLPEIPPELPQKENIENLEKLKEDFKRLGALQWVGFEGERAMHGKKYDEAREFLKQMNYEELLPVAEDLRQQYKEEYANTVVGESYSEQLQTIVLEQAQKHAEEIKASKIQGSQMAFGKGLETDDVLRVYLSPKLNKDLPASVNNILDKLTGLNAQIKINNADWYEDAGRVGSENAMKPSHFMNRIVVYLNRNSGDTTEFLQRLASDKALLSQMEDSGEWSYTSRIPIARGVNIAEGSKKSWDMDEGKKYTALKRWVSTRQWPDEYAIRPSETWFQKPEVQEATKTKSLEPLGRVTNMPSLKSD